MSRKEPISAGLPVAGPYNPGMKVGNIIEISGQAGLPAEGIQEQTRITLENIKKILTTSNASVSDITKITVFLKNMKDFQEMNEAYGKFFRMNGVIQKPPARTCIEMANLPIQNMLIEMEATAVILKKEKTWKDDVSTPALVIDHEKLKSNIKKMARFASDNNVNLRPHVKTHKCPEIARMQVEAGAKGICVAKVAEAEVFVKHGFDDILIANQIIGLDKIERLVELNKKANVSVAVDSHKNVLDLNDIASKSNVNLEIVIDVDVGLGRTGVKNKQDILEIAEMIRDASNLTLKGLMGYEGHLTYLMDEKVRESQTNACMKKLVDIKNLLIENGHNINYVTAAGSGTYMFAGKYPGITEIQPGTYVFWDLHMDKAIPGLFEQAITILATINNKTKKNSFTLDMGSKSCSVSDGLPKFKDNMELLKMTLLTEEHGQFKAKKKIRDKLEIGDKLELIPAHVCPTMNLYDFYYLKSDNKIINKWKILARGKNF